MNDLPNKDWPDEVKKAYEHLEIPSLYDAVLANEKLSNEIRRLNREIKNLTDIISHQNIQMKEVMGVLLGAAQVGEEEEIEESGIPSLEENQPIEEGLGEYELALFDERQERVLRDVRNALFETVDAVIDLSQNASRTLSPLKKSAEGIFVSKAAHEGSEVAELMVDQINAILYRVKAQLDELNISLIEPKEGDVFIPQKHRPIERVVGGKKGTVSQLIRVGYIQDNIVLRPADVILYG